MFVLRKLKGKTDEIRELQTEAEARKVMQEEFEREKGNYDSAEITDNSAYCNGYGSFEFVGWLIYEKPEAGDLSAQALAALKMADFGLTKFQFELESADDCGDHIADACDLIEQIRKAEAEKALVPALLPYLNGDYAILGVKNAFNGKTSYWISKKGCTISAYCFTSDSPEEVEYQLANGWSGYISLLEGALEKFKEEKNESGLGETTWKDCKWANWKECPHCGSSIQQAEDFRRSGLYEFCPRCGKRMSTHIGGEQQ